MIWRAVPAVIIVLVMGGCSRLWDANTMTDSFCLLYSPIIFSEQDSNETKIKILRYNYIWEQNCE